MEIGADHLYLKHDGLSGSLYGGNKRFIRQMPG